MAASVPGTRAGRFENGAGLLDRLLAALVRYVVFPSPQSADAVVLWIAASHAQSVFDAAPRLHITGPEKRCGKSRLLDMVEATCHAPFVTADASVAAVFRSIGPNPPTLIFDEVDAVFHPKGKAEGNEDLRALLNAGFQRNRPARRCVGPMQEVKAFETFAMAALAGIGELPDTITDRSVIVRMRRRAPGEEVEQYRMLRHRAPLRALGDEVGRWVRSVLAQLRDARPELPVEDRAADVWEPLVIVADVAGGSWPGRARAAALAMTREGASSATEQSLGVRLLSDCREVFATGVEEIGSGELVNKLCANPEAPWEGFGFTQNKLSHKLKPYGITPRQVRPGGGAQARGYRAADFRDAFARYLPERDPAPGGSPSAEAQVAAILAAASGIPDTPAGWASQTVTPSHPQLSPVTPHGAVTPQSVTRPRVGAGDVSFAPLWDGAGHEASPAAYGGVPGGPGGLVTLQGVTPDRTVTGLTCGCDGVTVCDGHGGGPDSQPCALCGERMDRIYAAAGAHPWCIEDEPP